MKKLILGLIICISPLYLLFGHNPLSATYYMEAAPEGSILNIYLSQQGVDYYFKHELGEDTYAGMDDTAKKELIVGHIIDNFELRVGGKNFPIGKGGVKLGTHQTDLKFILPALPPQLKEFWVKVSAFSENKNHQSLFTYKIGSVVGKVVLDEANDFQADVSVTTPAGSTTASTPMESAVSNFAPTRVAWIGTSVAFILLAAGLMINRPKLTR